VFVNLPNGDGNLRQYTVSSTAVRTRLQITVLRVRGVNGAPDGRVSSYLHDDVKIGDVLDVSAQAGDFVLTPTESPLLLASAAPAITTVLPIVSSRSRVTQPQRTVILFAPRRPQSSTIMRCETRCSISAARSTTSALTWYETSMTWRHPVAPGLHRSERHRSPDDVQAFTLRPDRRSCGTLSDRRLLDPRRASPSRIRYEVFGPDLWAEPKTLA
jgi:nitric oxide dioxygenase